ncbi:hypothetical protein ACS0TY_018289 [Phlomoides rotata]
MPTDSRSHQNLYKNLLASDMEGFIRVDPAYDVTYVIEHADSKYNYAISYQKAWQALKRARENVYGTWESSCQLLPKYMLALQKYNDGTIVEWLHKDRQVDGVFTLGYVFWAYKPCIEAFKHCRKILAVDGTHLYTKYRHKLLIANTLDANQKIISVAYAIVDEESYRSWKWFLDALARHFVGDIVGVCLISDRHAGLLKAVDEVPAFCEPIGVHRYCLRHVASNFNSQFKNVQLKDLCYRAGQALTVRNFELVMRQIEGLCHGAHEYLRAIDVNKWTFSYDGGHRYGVMTTNISEAINGVLKGTRRLPITAIVSATFTRSKNAFQEREVVAMNLQQRNQAWPDDVFNRIASNNKLGTRHSVDLYNHSRQTASVTVHVPGTSSRTFRVSLLERACDCGQWRLSGIPCSHALAVIRQYVLDITLYVPECYSTIEYALTYTSGFFAPLADVEYWDEPNFQLRHNPGRRIRRRGRDVTTRIYNEMDWAQTHARQQYQAQDGAGTSGQGSRRRR